MYVLHLKLNKYRGLYIVDVLFSLMDVFFCVVCCKAGDAYWVSNLKDVLYIFEYSVILVSDVSQVEHVLTLVMTVYWS